MLLDGYGREIEALGWSHTLLTIQCHGCPMLTHTQMTSFAALRHSRNWIAGTFTRTLCRFLGPVKPWSSPVAYLPNPDTTSRSRSYCLYMYLYMYILSYHMYIYNYIYIYIRRSLTRTMVGVTLPK